MADIFERSDIHSSMRGKSFLFLGDSIMRHIYKDFVFLTSPRVAGGLIPKGDLCAKGEPTYYGDKLIDATPVSAGRDYREVRDWYEESCDIQYTFAFITRCFNRNLRDFLTSYPEKFGSYPDVIIINSALWDINRWGPSGIRDFKDNIRDLMSLLKSFLPEYTQVIWMTTPPISADIRGGFMIKQLQFQQYSMRFNIMEGNAYAARLVSQFGYDVLDMHHYFYHDLHRRAPDGIHWNPDAVRMQVNIILTHICLSRDIPLPRKWMDEGNLHNTALDKAISIANAAEKGLGSPSVSAAASKPEEQKRDASQIGTAGQHYPGHGTVQQLLKKPQPPNQMMQSPMTMKQNPMETKQQPTSGNQNPVATKQQPSNQKPGRKPLKKAKRRMNNGWNQKNRPWARHPNDYSMNVFVDGMPVQHHDYWEHGIDYYGDTMNFHL